MTQIYNTVTKELKTLSGIYAGNGNCVTADGGIIVGSGEDDTPMIYKNGEEMDLSHLKNKYPFIYFHGITRDGSRAVGLVANPVQYNNETMSVPMYVDFNSDGTLGEVHYLPYPKKDWTQRDIQYASAVYISDDGKTIAGQICDYRGYSYYPIVYTQGEDGTWSYSLPTESLINPNNVEIPAWPGDFNEPIVNPEDYMTSAQKEAYEAAMEAWEINGFKEEEYPDVAEYMTDKRLKEYLAAVEAYEAVFAEWQVRNTAYYEALERAEMESLFFLHNGFTLSADGKKMGLCAIDAIDSEDPDAWPSFIEIYPTYLLSLEDKELTPVKGVSEDVYPIPRQILSDGTVISASPESVLPPMTYVILPGSDEYVSLADHLATLNPSGAAWIKEHLVQEVSVGYDEETMEPIFEKMLITGHGVVSDDWSVISGGLSLIDPETWVTSYQSYVIISEISNVTSVESEAKLLTTKYYDLNGFEVDKPGNGIYVEREYYSNGRVLTSKKAL
ncbi:MAG: hypothetical protein K2H76_06060 [Muribaculaceae bacterium]|nr:hypothetical protein [Muribaculaceae bacterium]